MPPTQLIRIAMLSGVLMFGGVVYFLRRSGDAPGFTPEQARAFVWIGRGLWAMAVLGCLFVFQAIQRTRTPRTLQTLHTVAWALGESVALFGGVVWLQGGNSGWYVSGLVFLVLALLTFNGKRA